MNFTWSHSADNNTTDKSEHKDYANFSDDQLLRQFKTENWSKLGESERIDITAAIKNRHF